MKNLEQKILLAQMDPEQVADEIGDFIVGNVTRFNATGGVLGLSGGIDSTTVAYLAKRGFDKHNNAHPDQQLELVGYILPSDTNNPADAIDGIKVAEELGIRYEVQNIEPIVQAYESTNLEATDNKFHKGNLMSRIRANVLNTKSATERKPLIGTGNRDEDFGIGYYTLFGDGAVHMSPIGELPKRLVRQMASYLGVSEELVNRTPSAGLEPGQTDFKDLGYSYDFVELVSEGIRQDFSVDELVGHNQVTSLAEKEMQQYGAVYGTSKFSSAEDMVYDVMKRHQSAMSKVSLVSPTVAEVALTYSA